MKTIHLYLCALLALALTGCSSDETPMKWSDDPDAVIVKASVGGLLTRSNPISDLQEENDKLTEFNEGDRIGITSNGETVAYTLTNGNWEPEAGKYLKWKLEENSYDFKVFYPYEGNTYDQFTPVTDQSSLENLRKADFMQVEPLYREIPDDRTITAQLGRTTARIVVNITHFNDQFAEGEKVTDIKFFTDGIPYRVTGDGGVGSTYVFLTPAKAKDGYSDFIAMTTSSGTQLKKANVGDLSAGHSYTFNLNVGKDRINIESVTVQDWTNGGLLPDGGELKKEDININLDDFDVNTLATELNKHPMGAIKVKGAWNDNYFPVFKKYLRDNKSFSISLDLSGVTGLTAIPDNALSGADGYEGNSGSGLSAIVLPSTVKSIGKESFHKTNLSSIDLTNVTSVGARAFWECEKLTNVTWPNAACTFGSCPFWYAHDKLLGNNYDQWIPSFTIPMNVRLENGEETNKGFIREGGIDKLILPAGYEGLCDYFVCTSMINTLVVEGDVTLPDNFMFNTTLYKEVDISNCSGRQPFLNNVVRHNEITVYVKTEELKKKYEDVKAQAEQAGAQDYKNMKFVVKTGE